MLRSTLLLALTPGTVEALFLPSQRKLTPTSLLGECEGFDCLERYVSLPDSSYDWHDTGVRLTGTDVGTSVQWTGHVLNMTSQTWNNPAGLDFPVWWHTMILVVPNNREIFDWSTVVLEFGMHHKADGQITRVSNRPANEPVQEQIQEHTYIDADNRATHLSDLQLIAEKAAVLATRTRAAVTVLLNVPNEYETFQNDPSGLRRFGDFLKSYSYIDFLDHPDQPERISELPIAKAVVRAMDTVTAFTASLPNGPVTRFGVTGYSKLGTTTWILGALDKRVEAIVPGAINFELDNLFDQALRAMELPAAIRSLTKVASPGRHPVKSVTKPESFDWDYQQVFMSRGLPEYDKLSSIIDPAKWLDKVNIPKLFVAAANDHMMPLLGEAAEPYLKNTTSYSAMKVVPNCDHDDTLVKSLHSAAAFFRGHLLGKSMPEFTSQHDRALHQVRQWFGSPTKEWSHVDISEMPGRKWTSLPSSASSAGSTHAFLELEYEWPEPGLYYSITSPEFSLDVTSL
eukprot:TRINITY_DN6123_c0_g1_i3.p1 TRINITY_DN6123_c0_g1~~TRINITY_DN6123_c0_g1_i3.p1  ORF type:complete len:513 (-),score=71.33 TRINITY_DN6123_c0_g1_i3:118-1656(-)